MSKKRQAETAAALAGGGDDTSEYPPTPRRRGKPQPIAPVPTHPKGEPAPTPAPADLRQLVTHPSVEREILEDHPADRIGGEKPSLPPALPPAAAPIAEAFGIVPPAPAEFRLVPPGRIHASPLNPRRKAAAAEVDTAFALSIAQHGVLQPILVRPSRQLDVEGEAFEIIMGSRRHQAVGRAMAGVSDGAGLEARTYVLPRDYLVPCLVRDCSDDELVILAGVENFDREGMAPTDEAELFQLMRPRVEARAGESREAAIARLFKISERTVWRRLALLKTIPAVRQELEAGKLTLQQAERFALASEDRQGEIFQRSSRNRDWETKEPRHLDPDDIAHLATADHISAVDAGFDLALYQGERIEDPATGALYFADRAEFNRLQLAALEAKAAAIRDGGRWRWVDVLGPGDPSFWSAYAEQDPGTYEKYKADDPDAGAVVTLDSHPPKIVVKCPVLRRKDAEARAKGRRLDLGAGAKAPERDPLTRAQQIELHAAKTRTLRRRLKGGQQQELALALTCLGLLGAREVQGLGGETWPVGPEADNRAISTEASQAGEIAAILEAARAPRHPRDKQLLKGNTLQRGGDGLDLQGEGARAWLEALMELPKAEIERLFRLLVAERVGSWLVPNGLEGAAIVGDSPLAVAIAGWLEPAQALVDPEDWRPSEQYFNQLKRDRLLQLARVIELEGGGKQDLTGIKKPELVALLLAQPAGTWKPEHFPECRFQLEKEARAAGVGVPLAALAGIAGQSGDALDELLEDAAEAAA
jgi:ParB family chromosome partitioning protein